MDEMKIPANRIVTLLWLLLILSGCGFSDDRRSHVFCYNGYSFLETDGVVDTFVADAAGGDDVQAWAGLWITYKSKHLRMSEIKEPIIGDLDMVPDKSVDSGMKRYSKEGLATARFRDGELAYLYIRGDSLIF